VARLAAGAGDGPTLSSGTVLVGAVLGHAVDILRLDAEIENARAVSGGMTDPAM
jgi:hypothetical protein